jgi:hypothetical protein
MCDGKPYELAKSRVANQANLHVATLAITLSTPIFVKLDWSCLKLLMILVFQLSVQFDFLQHDAS